MRNLQVGQLTYPISDSDSEFALSHALGAAFIELQQLEFGVISYLQILTNGSAEQDVSFDLFASKTFGNLLREMSKHPILLSLAGEMTEVKKRRDFFIHKFLFHRYGGPLLTGDSDYELLIREAHEVAIIFARSRYNFDRLMLETAPLKMIAGKIDPASGEIFFVESEYAKAQRS